MNCEYYFEAVGAQHEAQFLALCPLCATMYKEFVKKDEAAMADPRKALLNADLLEVPLCLGELDTSIRFVETHYHDVKTILQEMRWRGVMATIQELRLRRLSR